jgi:hypothetical protein
MIYYTCDSCRYETTEVSDICKMCKAPYVCEWSPAWYSTPFLTRASIGQSAQARKAANAFVAAVGVFVFYAFVVTVASNLGRNAWNNFFGATCVLAFCSYLMSKITQLAA